VTFLGFRGKHYVKQLILSATVVTASSICSLTSAAAIAFLLDHTGHAMSWFSNTFLLFGLYAVPACGVALLACLVAKRCFYEVPSSLMHFYFCTFAVSSYLRDVFVKLDIQN